MSSLSKTKQAIWSVWNSIPDGEPSPVKRIASQLGISTAEVADTVYPVRKFGHWDDSQEPDLSSPIPADETERQAWMDERAQFIASVGHAFAQQLHDYADTVTAAEYLLLRAELYHLHKEMVAGTDLMDWEGEYPHTADEGDRFADIILDMFRANRL